LGTIATKIDKRCKMLKKLTPLIILAMFLGATYFMIQGMQNATALANPKLAKEKR